MGAALASLEAKYGAKGSGSALARLQKKYGPTKPPKRAPAKGTGDPALDRIIALTKAKGGDVNKAVEIYVQRKHGSLKEVSGPRAIAEPIGEWLKSTAGRIAAGMGGEAVRALPSMRTSSLQPETWMQKTARGAGETAGGLVTQPLSIPGIALGKDPLADVLGMATDVGQRWKQPIESVREGQVVPMALDLAVALGVAGGTAKGIGKLRLPKAAEAPKVTRAEAFPELPAEKYAPKRAAPAKTPVKAPEKPAPKVAVEPGLVIKAGESYGLPTGKVGKVDSVAKGIVTFRVGGKNQTRVPLDQALRTWESLIPYDQPIGKPKPAPNPIPLGNAENAAVAKAAKEPWEIGLDNYEAIHAPQTTASSDIANHQAYTNRVVKPIAKALSAGWKSSRDLVPKTASGTEVSHAVQIAKDLGAQVAWDAEGNPHYALPGLPRPRHLYSESDLAGKAKPAQPPATLEPGGVKGEGAPVSHESLTEARLLERENAVRERLKGKSPLGGEGGFLGFGTRRGKGGIDPTAMNDMLELGAIIMARKGMNAGRWGKAMTEEFGSSIKPELPKLFRATLAEHRKLVEEVDPAYKMEASLRRIRSVMPEKQKMYKAERAKRVGTALARFENAPEGTPAAERFRSLYGELKGEFEQPEWTRTGNWTDTDYSAMLESIAKSPKLSGMQRAAAKEGLDAVMRLRMPEPKQQVYLERVFGGQWIKGIRDSLGNVPTWQKILGTAVEIGNFPRAYLQTSGDQGHLARQGNFAMLAEPVTWAKTIPTSLKSLVSGAEAERLAQVRRKHPRWDVWEDAGLVERSTEASNLAGREESFMSRVGERIPVLGPLARAGNRSMTEFGNWLRLNTAEKMLKAAQNEATRRGIKDVPFETMERIAKMVNGMSGQGNLGAAERLTPSLASILYSPRYKLGRMQHVWHSGDAILKDPLLRKTVARQWVQYTGTALGILAAAKAAGLDVDMRPESTEFGKIKVGNTRFDVTGGMAAVVRVIARIGLSRSAEVGKPTKKTKGFDELVRFGSYQLAPLPSNLLYSRGMYKPGMPPFKPTREVFARMAEENLLPFTANDVMDAVRLEGWERAATVGPLAYFGVGAQTYERDKKPKRGVRPTTPYYPKAYAP